MTSRNLRAQQFWKQILKTNPILEICFKLRKKNSGSTWLMWLFQKKGETFHFRLNYTETWCHSKKVRISNWSSQTFDRDNSLKNNYKFQSGNKSIKKNSLVRYWVLLCTNFAEENWFASLDNCCDLLRAGSTTFISKHHWCLCGPCFKLQCSMELDDWLVLKWLENLLHLQFCICFLISF